MIFPIFENGHVIDALRNRYDPLANHVRPHITLVFPFDSEVETLALQAHIQSVLTGFAPFELLLCGISTNRARYLFLNLQKGGDKIIELHKRLYTGILREYSPKWLEFNPFSPHMTIGKFDREADFIRAIHETRDFSEVFRTEVHEVSVELIDDNEDSFIELVVQLA